MQSTRSIYAPASEEALLLSTFQSDCCVPYRLPSANLQGNFDEDDHLSSQTPGTSSEGQQRAFATVAAEGARSVEATG